MTTRDPDFDRRRESECIALANKTCPWCHGLGQFTASGIRIICDCGIRAWYAKQKLAEDGAA